MVQNPFNMTGYTKLFGSIVDSTIWRESKDTKIVWITMLAKANRDGMVEASLPGLADASRVTIEECIEALKCLSSPDKYSRTKAFEGRRIEEIEGGWKILNHAKYRAKMNADERREYFRLKKQEQRLSNPVHKSPTLSNSVSKVTQAESKADTEAMKKGAAAPSTDAEWIKSLRDNPAYAGIDVERELGKMTAWCSANQKQPSRRRFVNWLNRAEKPMAGATPRSTGADTVILGKEYERVTARMATIRSTYGDHQSWSEGDKKEFQKLKARRDELRTILKITI